MNKEAFFEKVSNDFDRYSFFVSIQLNKSDSKNVFIIENDDLYNFMQSVQNLSKEQYQNMIKDKLKNNLPLVIQSPSSYFIKVPNVPSVDVNAKKGIDDFIKTYFDNGKVLKDGITDDERTAIIQKLFEWEIPSKIDDETGYLVIFR